MNPPFPKKQFDMEPVLGRAWRTQYQRFPNKSEFRDH